MTASLDTPVCGPAASSGAKEGIVYALSAVLLRHLEPALDMMEAAIRACPAHKWQGGGTIGPAEHIYHALPFQPPPFHDENAAMMSGPADQSLDKDTLLDYLERMRRKCRSQLNVSDVELLAEEAVRGRPVSLADRCLMQIRHIQHHVGVLHRMIREETAADLPWREHSGTADAEQRGPEDR